MTLDDAIRLALRNNRDLLDARLARTVQEFALDVAEDRYRPIGAIRPSAQMQRYGDTVADGFVETGLRIPTGGQVTLRWSKPLAGQEDTSGIVSLRFSQPLLRGFGTEIDTAPLRVARLREQMNVLSFRDAITSVVVSTIRAWRSLVRANRQLEIAEGSLKRAQEQYEISEILIQAGQMAERDRLQNEADIAERELARLQARNGVTTANFRLINVLDIESGTVILPAEGPAVRKPVPGLEESIETALRHSPAYAAAQLNKEIAAIDLKVAANNRLWDLSLDTEVWRAAGGGAPAGGGLRTDYSVGLRLDVLLFDRSRQFNFVSARADVRRAERDLAELRQLMSISVRQAVYDVEMGLRRIDLARQSRELAEQKLGIERSKLQQGLSSTFQLNRFEDDLVRAENAEIDAAVNHENALTSLNETLGTTLETWDIRVEQVAR